jgi:hypothetical protein
MGNDIANTGGENRSPFEQIKRTSDAGAEFWWMICSDSHDRGGECQMRRNSQEKSVCLLHNACCVGMK